MSKKKNNYIIKVIEEYSLKDPARFGIRISFERDIEETYSTLINNTLMCAMLVRSSVNFIIDAKDSNRAAILIALLLVLTTLFNGAKVRILKS